MGRRATCQATITSGRSPPLVTSTWRSTLCMPNWMRLATNMTPNRILSSQTYLTMTCEEALTSRDSRAVDTRVAYGPLRTVSGTCGAGSLRGVNTGRGPVFRGQQGHNCRLDTPITIALSSGGDQFVSLNLDQQQQQQQQHRQQSSFQ